MMASGYHYTAGAHNGLVKQGQFSPIVLVTTSPTRYTKTPKIPHLPNSPRYQTTSEAAKFIATKTMTAFRLEVTVGR